MDEIFGLAIFHFELLDLGLVDEGSVEAQDLLTLEELGLDLWLRLGHSYFIAGDFFELQI